MAKRFAYWVIVAGSQPTAFRARYPEDLIPTLKQLQRTQPDTVMRWFERGKLWESPDAALADLKARRTEKRTRGEGWRPGGTHKDPRAQYQLTRDQKRARFKERQRRPPRAFGPPADDAGGKPERPFGSRPPGAGGKFGRPYGNRPPGAHGKFGRPYGNRPPGGDGKSGRPYGGRPPGNSGKPGYGSRPAGGGGKPPFGSRPQGDRPFGRRPPRPPSSGGNFRPGNRPRSFGGRKPPKRKP